MVTSTGYGKCLLVGLSLGLASGVNAQNRATQHQRQARQPQGQPSATQGAALEQICQLSAVIGVGVRNQKNESLGEVRDIALTQAGEFRYLIVSYGGIAGIGRTCYAVPWNQVTMMHQEKIVMLDLNETMLEQLPKLESDDYRELRNAEWRSTLDRSFSGGTTAQQREERQSPRQGRERDVERAVPGQFLFASKVIGAKVQGQGGKELAEVHDLILRSGHRTAKAAGADRAGRGDARSRGSLNADDQRDNANRRNSGRSETNVESDRVAFAVLDIGGALGIGGTRIAIPFTGLSFRRSQENELAVQVAMSGEQLKEAPELKKEGLSDLQDEAFVRRTIQFFGESDRREIETESPRKPSQPQRGKKQLDK